MYFADMHLADLRLAARHLRQSPLFTFVALLSLAVGIGANTALFSFLHAMVLAPLPYPDSERLVLLQESVQGRDANGNPHRLEDWAAQEDLFTAVAGWYSESPIWTGGERAERVEAWRSYGDLPATFGLVPIAGRGLTPAERDGRQPAALVMEGFWRQRFAADPTLVGRTLTLDGRSVPVVGVLGGSLGSGRIEVVLPARDHQLPRSARFLRQVGRLRPGVSKALAEERLAALAQRLALDHPVDDRNLGIRLESYRAFLATRARGSLLALLGCVAFVLVSACLNIASLLLERARMRGGELSVRLALGAGRWRLARLLLAEGLLLATAGGALGLLLAVWGIALLKGLSPADLPRLDEVRMSWPTLAFAGGLSLLTAALASLAPAWRASVHSPQRVLQAASIRLGGGRNRTGGTFVVAQIAISLALLFGASLLLRTFSQLLTRPLGYSSDGLLAFDMPVSWSSSDAAVQRFQGDVLAVLRALPGVSAAEMIDRLPLEGGAQDGEPRIEGRAADRLPAAARIGHRQVSLGLLPMLGVPLLEGRPLEALDVRGGTRVALLNRAGARLYFPGKSPIGARIGLAYGGGEPDYFEIVGVVGDLPNEIAEASPQPAFYTPIERGFWPIASFVVRTELPPAAARESLRAALARHFPNHVPERFRTLSTVLSSAVAQPRLTASMVAAFAVSALLLAAAGLYALLSNSIAARRFELGVRLAVGAGREDIHRLVLRSALPLVAGGITLGIAGCWLVQKAVAGLLFGVSPLDPASAAAAAGLLAVTALLAISLPARRAAGSDPGIVLRGE